MTRSAPETLDLKQWHDRAPCHSLERLVSDSENNAASNVCAWLLRPDSKQPRQQRIPLQSRGQWHSRVGSRLSQNLLLPKPPKILPVPTSSSLPRSHPRSRQ